MNNLAKVYQKGPIGISKALLNRVGRIYHQIRTKGVDEYNNPDDSELEDIEKRLVQMGVICHDLEVDSEEFGNFIQCIGFPLDYHGGPKGGVYQEKLLEHFIVWKFLNFLHPDQYTPYVDIAASSSPWVKLLREKGIESFAIDLTVPALYSTFSYYRQEDATRTNFEDNSIKAASLQCAYEMFMGDNDIKLLQELGRILKEGGRVVISPLYMHTHACYYQTPEYYGQSFGDKDAKRYVRRDTWGVSSSRKYSPESLHTRVLKNAIHAGLQPSLYVLRKKKQIAEGIYLHFILVLDKFR